MLKTKIVSVQKYFRKTVAISLLTAVLLSLTPQNQKAAAATLTNTGAPAGFTINQVVSGLALPTVAQFAPDGRIFIGQKDGTVRIFKNGVLLSQPFYTVANVNNYVDRGLLGLAFDPSFSINGFVYLLFTYDNNPSNLAGPKTGRLLRVTANSDVALAGSERIILGTNVGDSVNTSCDNFAVTSDCLPADSLSHAPGTVRFAPDGKLIVSVGDGAGYDNVDLKALRAQNLNSLAGKILRVNSDGTAPADNPFYNGDPNANRSKVWAYGVRNSFRVSIRPSDGLIVGGDVGWNIWEEINVITKGANLGWPCYEGFDQQNGTGAVGISAYKDLPFCQNLYASPGTNLKFPTYTYPHPPSSAVIGGVFYTGTSYPAAYQNSYFFADYPRSQIYTLKLDVNNNLVPGSVATFASNNGGAVNFFTGLNGDIFYVAINTGTINQISYTTGNLPPVAVASSDKNSGAAPLTVNFSSSGSVDPENGPLSFNWNFADGTADATTASATHTFITNGTYNVILTVTDDHNNKASAVVTVYVGVNAPIVTINTPADFARYNPGDVVNFSGGATNPQDNTIPAAGLTWNIVIQHCPLNDCHAHFLTTITGSGGAFVFPAHDEPYYIEISLTAKDSVGLSTTKSVSVYPADAVINHAMLLNGVNNYAQAANSLVNLKTQQLTAEVWYKSLTTGVWGGEIISMGNNWGLRLQPDGNIKFFFNGPVGWENFVTTGLNLKDGVWHQLSVSKSPTQIKIFVDGVLKNTFASADPISYIYGQNLILGRHGDSDDHFNFNGTIDEVRLWDFARSDSDIVATYNKVISAKQPDLVAYYRFEEGNGNFSQDLTGNGHGLTLYNGVLWTAGIPLSVLAPANFALNLADGNFVTVGSTKDLKLQQFTLEAYIKASQTGIYGSEVLSLGNNWGLRINWDGNVVFFTRTTTGWENLSTVGVNVLDNAWHQITIVRTSNQTFIYVDGVLKLNTSSNPTIVYNLGTNLVIGKHAEGDNNFNFTGSIDEVRIWSTSRTAIEINNSRKSEIDPSTAGLVAYFKADEGAGTVLADATILGHTGSIVGATYTVGAPISTIVSVNASAGFDGAGSQVFIQGSPNYNLNSFSVESWFNSTNVGIWGGEIISNGNNWGVRLLPDGNIRFFFHIGNFVWRNFETVGLNLKDGQWHQVAVTKDSGNVKIYIDSILKNTFANSENISYTLGQNMILGRHGDGDNNFNFTGKMDEVRIWNTVRTTAEIVAYYQKEIPAQFGLVGYWKFNENSQGTAKDTSGNNNVALLLNGAYWQSGFPLVP